MKIIGLTGGIATGKSTISKLFQRVGIRVIDADNVYKELSKPGKLLYNKIIMEFSSAIVGSDYLIDWKKLAGIVFNDEAKRLRLNALTHPEVKREINDQITKMRATGEPFIVLEIPLLFETGYQAVCDATLVVSATLKVQVARLMSRDAIDKETALKRISSQMPIEEKVKLATFVIDNSFDMTKTEKQFYDVLEKIRRI
jgi:dephospho-CoA kinase